MVFYISASDQPKASEMFKKFLTERKLGAGHVMAAMRSPQEGLSWAYEPSQQQKKSWQEVSGSSEDTSFNSLVATMAMPTYLERLAIAHLRKGDKASADIYTKEASRVRAVLANLKAV